MSRYGKQTKWTEEELQALRDYYPRMGGAAVKYLPGRTPAMIKGQAHLYGIRFRKNGEDQDYDICRFYRQGMNDGMIARRLMISQETVRRCRGRHDLPAIGLTTESRQLLTTKALRRGAKERAVRQREVAEGRREAERQRKEQGRYDRSIRRKDESVITFTADQDEFLIAVLAFRTKHRRPPSLVEGFRIAKSLLWRKDDG